MEAKTKRARRRFPAHLGCLSAEDNAIFEARTSIVQEFNYRAADHVDSMLTADAMLAGGVVFTVARQVDGGRVLA